MEINNTLNVEIKIPGLCVEEFMNDSFQSSFNNIIEDIENMQYKANVNCEDANLKTGDHTLDILKMLKYAFLNAKINP